MADPSAKRAHVAAKKTARALLLLAVLSLVPALGGCHTMSIRVGSGSNNIGQVTMHQYYMFFGLMRLNEVDIQRYVADYTTYDVEFGFSNRDGFFATLGDLFVSSLFLPLTVTRQTVTVKW